MGVRIRTALTTLAGLGLWAGSAVASGPAGAANEAATADATVLAATVSTMSVDLCSLPDGTTYVLESAGGAGGQVIEVTSAGSVSTFVAATASLTNPEGIACGTDALFASLGNGDIMKMPLASPTPSAYSTGNSFIPGSLGLDATGRLLVVAQNQATIYVVAPGGGSAASLNVSGLNTGLYNIAVGAAAFFISNQFTGEIFKAPLAGGPASVVASGGHMPAGLALDAAGNLWSVDLTDSTMTMVPGSGASAVSVTLSGVPLGGPGGLAWGGGVLHTQSIDDVGQPLLSLSVTGPPGAPQDVSAVLGAGGVATVTWSAPLSDGGNDIEHYVVTASPGGATCTTTTHTCELAGLMAGTTYSIVVNATSRAGVGAPSSPVLLSLPAPPAPDLPATGGGGLGVVLGVLLLLLGVALLRRTNRAELNP